MIDPHELRTIETHWLRDLKEEVNNLQEVDSLFSMPGWKHLEKLLAYKEEVFTNAAVNANDLGLLRGHRQVIEFVRWLRALPAETTNQLLGKIEELEREEGHGDEG